MAGYDAEIEEKAWLVIGTRVGGERVRHVRKVVGHFLANLVTTGVNVRANDNGHRARVTEGVNRGLKDTGGKSSPAGVGDGEASTEEISQNDGDAVGDKDRQRQVVSIAHQGVTDESIARALDVEGLGAVYLRGNDEGVLRHVGRSRDSGSILGDGQWIIAHVTPEVEGVVGGETYPASTRRNKGVHAVGEEGSESIHRQSGALFEYQFEIWHHTPTASVGRRRQRERGTCPAYGRGLDRRRVQSCRVRL
jgi:hypothetical protein